MMSIQNVLKYPHPLLTRISVPVKVFDLKLLELVNDMFETMYTEDGVGLAAPQIGISKQIMVISPNAKSGQERAFINLEITHRSKDEEVGIEGCLSVPGFTAEISRPVAIQFEAQDVKGNTINEEVRGFAARVIQHELDHLNGILLIDHARFFHKGKTLKASHHRL
jgi:peptide deformylase